MIALGAFVIGAVTSALLWVAMRRQLASAPGLLRRNYRGREIPVAAGIVIVLAAIVGGAGYAAVVRVNGVSDDEALRGATILGGGTIGFALIGLFDDLAGATETKGFRGHIRALTKGELTTGMVKLVWGLLLGFLATGLAPVDVGLVDSIRIGLVIAAAANVANLFDRAPGRVIKLSLAGAVVIAMLGAGGWALSGPMLILGAGLGLLAPDLRERCMIGDTGANVLGAAVGFGLVLTTGDKGQWIALAVLMALNLASELVSFSRVIDRNPVLRWLDRVGTLPERRRG